LPELPETDFCLPMQKKRSEAKSQIKPDGIIRIRREVKGRKGKTVTTITGFDLDDKSLNLLSKQLKQHCGTGGSVKDGVVIIQGDQKDTIKSLFEGRRVISFR
jgi:translation initiation factor 1